MRGERTREREREKREQERERERERETDRQTDRQTERQRELYSLSCEIFAFSIGTSRLQCVKVSRADCNRTTRRALRNI